MILYPGFSVASSIIPPKCCVNLSAVDLTTLDPWKGSVTAPQSGLWRFSFEGIVQVGVGQAVVELRVNDVTVARSDVAPGLNVALGLYQISINDLVQVEAGDAVEINWVADGDAGEHTHMTSDFWSFFTPCPHFVLI